MLLWKCIIIFSIFMIASGHSISVIIHKTDSPRLGSCLTKVYKLKLPSIEVSHGQLEIDFMCWSNNAWWITGLSIGKWEFWSLQTSIAMGTQWDQIEAHCVYWKRSCMSSGSTVSINWHLGFSLLKLSKEISMKMKQASTQYCGC